MPHLPKPSLDQTLTNNLESSLDSLDKEPCSRERILIQTQVN